MCSESVRGAWLVVLSLPLLAVAAVCVFLQRVWATDRPCVCVWHADCIKLEANCNEAVQKKKQPRPRTATKTDIGSGMEKNDMDTMSSQNDQEDAECQRAAEKTQAYLERSIDMIRDEIEDMPTGSRFVLLVPTELFFHATLFNYLFSFSLDPEDDMHKVKTCVPGKLAAQLHEMKVHADFMQVFVPFYIHPTYAETASVVERRSKFFFAHHHAMLESVPRGIFLTTSMRGCLAHVAIQNELMTQETGTNVFGESGRGGGVVRNIPTIARPFIHDILELIRCVRTMLNEYVLEVTRVSIYANADADGHLMHSLMRGETIIRDMLHLITFIATNDLCGRLKWLVQKHAGYIRDMLQVIPLQHTHAVLLFFILDNIEARIA